VSIIYVALGDSTGAGFGVARGEGYVERVHGRFREQDPAARLVNLATNGATSLDVRQSQVERAMREQPTVSSLFVGANDLFRGIEPREFAKNLRVIADRLDRSRGHVVLGTLPNLAYAPAAKLAENFLGITRGQIEQRIREYNQSIHRLAIDHGFGLVDLFDMSLADHPEYFASDGLHPSVLGHAAWFARIWPTFEQLVERSLEGH
jgi:acyl-CoA thioesterase-1